jgi:hypothetical protein
LGGFRNGNLRKGIIDANRTFYFWRTAFLVRPEQMDIAQIGRPNLNIGFLWRWKHH